MIKHSIQQEQNGEYAKPFGRPMSVVFLWDFTYGEK